MLLHGLGRWVHFSSRGQHLGLMRIVGDVYHGTGTDPASKGVFTVLESSLSSSESWRKEGKRGVLRVTDDSGSHSLRISTWPNYLSDLCATLLIVYLISSLVLGLPWLNVVFFLRLTPYTWNGFSPLLMFKLMSSIFYPHPLSLYLKAFPFPRGKLPPKDPWNSQYCERLSG